MDILVGIGHLSNEILALMFRFLDCKSFLRANTVCKAWSQFHKEDYIWKSMYYRDFIDFKEHGLLPNLTFATLYKKCVLYRDWKLVHTHKTYDEAWHVSFSPNGKYVASSDKAGALKIWELHIQQEPTPSVTVEAVFTRTYLEPISRHEWSPSSDQLLCTMGSDSATAISLKDWNDKMDYVRVSSFDWYAGYLNDDQILRSGNPEQGSFDTPMYLMDVAKSRNVWKATITTPPASLHFGILSPKKTYMTGATTSATTLTEDLLLDELWLVEIEQLRKRSLPYKIVVDEYEEYNILDDEEGAIKIVPVTRDDCKVIQESGHIVGFCYSENEEQLLINVRNFANPNNDAIVDEIETHLWDLKTMTKINSWVVGECNAMFIIHPSFALGEQIICSGSGDGKLTLVHKHSENVIYQLKAHEKLLNFATVHPQVDLLVTASDSNEVKFWIPKHSDLSIKFE